MLSFPHETSIPIEALADGEMCAICIPACCASYWAIAVWSKPLRSFREGRNLWWPCQVSKVVVLPLDDRIPTVVE